MDYKEIIKAWMISFNPTKEQSMLAEERLKICNDCKFKQEIIKKNGWSAVCGKCGCPLIKKSFSQTFNACPEKLWEKVDKKYINVLDTKNNNTII